MEQNLQKETLNINQKIKKIEIEEEKKQQFADDQEQINSIQKGSQRILELLMK